ncbi:DUF5681 domain-containing protein [Acidiphilium acidophilum]|uniref:DUF5681 domain-containing protein n=1 Tax=Acidiphilium acidophilum TaxID=76588 RepID=A0AAW9DRJ5_ACIAO|nr:DUF5681 domain-containing protein [Acidiphilium acidophilum]MDX5931829.1 DUF5681 domain-containing protein [Acidiphilium acidophilum]MEE3502608.1 DUF5681 domain-containing protein [Acidiphilium acidophilum]GBR76635.1 hypothetical protein AA700_0625 [Acidiphilium acidophilum DSM 700]
MPPDNSEPKQDGRFKPGQSGNPAGKPRGARHKAVQALDILGRNASEEIVLAVIQQAKSGDMRAAELVLRRVWPERKGSPVELDLPTIRTAEDAMLAMSVVTDAAAAGTISPDEGEGFAKLIEAHRRAIETADLAERIAALEADRRNQP